MNGNCCGGGTEIVDIQGTEGINSFTNTTVNFVIPAIGSNVSINVLQTAWMVVGEPVVITGIANFTVVSIDTPTSFTAKFLGLSGDLAVGSTISLGASVCPTGVAGKGLNGYAILTSSFVVPSVNNTVNVAVDNSGAFVVGEYVIANGPANFIVTAIPSATQMTLKFLFNANDATAGTTIASGTVISPAGRQGVNAYTKTTAQFTVPAVNTSVDVSVLATEQMAIGQVLVIDGPATFSVVAINSPTSVTLSFLDYYNDVPTGSLILNNSTVTPSGTQPFPANSAYVQGLSEGSPQAVTTTSTALAGIAVSFAQSGFYFITATVNLEYSATYHGNASANAVTVAIYSSSTFSPIAGGTVVVYPSTATLTVQMTFQQVCINPTPLQGLAGTSLSIQVNSALAPVAGAINVVGATMTIFQIQPFQ